MPKTYHGKRTLPDGSALAGATLEFVPEPREAFKYAGAMVAPGAVEAVTDEAGEFTVVLIPAEYAVRTRAANGMRLPTFKTMARENTDETDWLKTVEAAP